MGSPTDPEPALARLARHVVDAAPDARTLAIARASFVDTAACMLAGAHCSEPIAAARLSKGMAGPGLRALRLGAAAHATDFDDYEPVGSTHPSAVLVPAVLALAESRPTNLGAALTSYVAGYEIILAVGAALGYGHYLAGWHSTSTIAGVGAAAAASRLPGLSVGQTRSSLSMAMTQAAGLKRQFGSDTKALHAGFAARAGVDSALLAADGIGAAADAADGSDGYLALYGGASAPGWSTEAQGIAEQPPFRKAAPCCGYVLRAVDAAAALAGQDGFDVGSVADVRIEIGAPYLAVAHFTAPKTPHEARFSVTWCVGATLARGALGPNAFADAALADPRLRGLEAVCRAERYALAPGLGDVSPEAPDRVRVTLSDGTVLEETCAVPRGGPGRDFTREDLLGKLEACGGDPEAGAAFLDAPEDGPLLPPGGMLANVLD